jgi:hypothetical protein
VLATLNRYRGFAKDKGPREEPKVNEKKVGGKTIHYLRQGRLERWGQGVAVIDRHVFARGRLQELELLLLSKAKRSDEFNRLVALADDNALVAGFQGKHLRGALNREFRRFDGPPDEKAPPLEEKDDRAARQKPVKDSKEDGDVLIPPELVPYKPLLMMRSGLITANVNKGYAATVRITFDGQTAADEGELALKTLLYVLRELAATAPKLDPGLRPLAPVTESVRKACKAARVQRKGNMLTTSVSLTVDAAAVKKAASEFEAERKRREDRSRKLDKDKSRRFDED